MFTTNSQCLQNNSWKGHNFLYKLQSCPQMQLILFSSPEYHCKFEYFHNFRNTIQLLQGVPLYGEYSCNKSSIWIQEGKRGGGGEKHGHFWILSKYIRYKPSPNVASHRTSISINIQEAQHYLVQKRPLINITSTILNLHSVRNALWSQHSEPVESYNSFHGHHYED